MGLAPGSDPLILPCAQSACGQAKLRNFLTLKYGCLSSTRLLWGPQQVKKKNDYKLICQVYAPVAMTHSQQIDQNLHLLRRACLTDITFGHL